MGQAEGAEMLPELLPRARDRLLVPADAVHRACRSRAASCRRRSSVRCSRSRPSAPSRKRSRRPTTRPTACRAVVWTDKGAKIFRMTRGIRAGVVWANTFNKFDPTAPVRRLQGERHGPRRRPSRSRLPTWSLRLMAARAPKRSIRTRRRQSKSRCQWRVGAASGREDLQAVRRRQVPAQRVGPVLPARHAGRPAGRKRLPREPQGLSRRRGRGARRLRHVVAGERVSARPDAVPQRRKCSRAVSEQFIGRSSYCRDVTRSRAAAEVTDDHRSTRLLRRLGG